MTETDLTFRTRAESASDIERQSPLLRLSPRFLRPYLRLARFDRPIGTWLLLFPGWWGILIAQGEIAATFGVPTEPDLRLIALFALGALVMRGAGCVVNDLADRDFDAKVARTASRPLPSGEVSPFQAVVFLAILMSIGLAVLLQLQPLAIALGVGSLALVALYPFMKRITFWPQAWLGLTFNWGALLGYAAAAGDLGLPAYLLYAGGFFWTLGYDTIYAHQDKEDDALIGVKSTALKLGPASRVWVRGFYSAAAALFLAAGWVAGLGPIYLGAVLVAYGQMLWQAARVDFDDARSCQAAFKSNQLVGWALAFGLMANAFLP